MACTFVPKFVFFAFKEEESKFACVSVRRCGRLWLRFSNEGAGWVPFTDTLFRRIFRDDRKTTVVMTIGGVRKFVGDIAFEIANGQVVRILDRFAGEVR